MTIDQVTVLSTDGTVLAAGGDAFLANSGKMVGLEKRVSSDMQDNVRQTLTPYLGLGNFEVSVAARLNTDKRQINETNYDPEGRVERSVRTVKDTGSSQNANRAWATGVEQNVPAEEGAAQSGGDQSKRQNERREETVNYEVSTKTTATVSEGYKIEKLAVAVVINRKRLAAVLGESASPGALEARIKEVERLVTSAAGADTKRGDQITVEAVDFAGATNGLEPVPGPPVVDQLLHYTGAVLNSLTVLAVTVLLIWFGLKPALKVLAQQAPPPQLAATPILAVSGAAGARAIGAPGAAGVSEATAGLPPPEGEAPPGSPPGTGPARGLPPKKRLEQIVQFKEQQAAALLKQWMRE